MLLLKCSQAPSISTETIYARLILFQWMVQPQELSLFTQYTRHWALMKFWKQNILNSLMQKWEEENNVQEDECRRDTRRLV